MRRALFLALVLAACGEPVTVGGNAAGGAGGSQPPQLPAAEITFRTCKIGNIDMTCGVAELPLDPDDPGGRKVEVNVYRLSPDGPPVAQLWMLQGGPGDDGSSLLFQGRFFQRLGYQVYLPDYRGVGKSSTLACSEVAAQEGTTSPACLADIQARWGDALRHFGTTDSARDIGQMILGTRQKGLPVEVWAVSYGTLVANRLLHLFPEIADAVVLDSSCPPTGCVATGIDANMERTARKLLELCGEDAFCAARLGSDPQARLDDLTERIRAGHCSEVKAGTLGARDFLREVLAATLTSPGSAAVGLSAIYRFDRCDPADVSALEQLAFNLGLQAPPNLDDHGGSPLGLYIVYSEFWDRSRHLADYEKDADRLEVTQFAALAWAHRFESFPWPPIEVPEEQRTWAPTDRPVLLLEGSLDPRTPPEEVSDFASAHHAPGQQMILMPFAIHGVLNTSQWVARYETCGWRLTSNFLSEPSMPAGDACVGQQRPPNLRGSPNLAAYLYGTTDLWENGPAGFTAPDPELEAEVQELRERLRHPPGF